ncbi:MAG: Cyclic dehypoxanthine futalosine synthase, partial [uncultured Gemmatimonadetes bacterium]
DEDQRNFRCRGGRGAHLGGGRARPVAARERRRAETPRRDGAGALPRAGPRHLHGDAHHQLHQRVRGAVRLLRLLRASQPGGRVRAHPRGRLRQDRRAAGGGGRPGGLQRRVQSQAPAALLLRPVRRRARPLRRRGGVLRAHHRRVHVPGRPRGAFVRGHGGAAARGGGALGDGRRLGDPDRGLPQAPREVQVHGGRVPEGPARRGGRGAAHHGHHGDRLRRDAGRAAGAPAAHARPPGRVPGGRAAGDLLLPPLELQAVGHGAGGQRGEPARVLEARGAVAHLPGQHQARAHLRPHPERGRLPRPGVRRGRLRPAAGGRGDAEGGRHHRPGLRTPAGGAARHGLPGGVPPRRTSPRAGPGV